MQRIEPLQFPYPRRRLGNQRPQAERREDIQPEVPACLGPGQRVEEEVRGKEQRVECRSGQTVQQEVNVYRRR